jgi:ribosomal protein S18 acetylase RimI-like enzyme
LRSQVEKAGKTDMIEVSFLFRKILRGLIYYNSLAKWHESRKYSAELLAKKSAEDPYSVLVAKDERGAVVGFCFNHMDDFTVWIDWFGVDYNARKKGVGEAILAKTFQTARSRGAHKVWCDTRSDNEPSKSLLRKVGFKELVTIKNHWYRQDFTLWERRV